MRLGIGAFAVAATEPAKAITVMAKGSALVLTFGAVDFGFHDFIIQQALVVFNRECWDLAIFVFGFQVQSNNRKGSDLFLQNPSQYIL